MFADKTPKQQERLLAAIAHLQEHGRLNRADIMRIGGISYQQAAIDLRAIRAEMPGLMHYDQNEKAYLLTEKSA